MEVKELKRKSLKELVKLLSTLREKLRDMRFKISADQLKNVREIRNLKKDIARILTMIRAKREKEPVKEADIKEEKNNTI
ncbi:MAG: hypothetical protein ACD_12C00488G0003 [uncultured bacterium]|nr:MAG: hypothetical protein ACD_12C00488G0003 [uncultured bacterium]